MWLLDATETVQVFVPKFTLKGMLWDIYALEAQHDQGMEGTMQDRLFPFPLSSLSGKRNLHAQKTKMQPEIALEGIIPVNFQHKYVHLICL